MALSYQWGEEDIRWLQNLAQRVPLAQGRMEIHSGLFAVGWRLSIGLAFIAFGSAGAIAVIWQGEADLSRALMMAFFAALGLPITRTYGKRVWGLIRRRPEFVLSRLGITINGRLLQWSKVRTLELDWTNIRSYRSYFCKIVLRDGEILSLDLDTISLSRQRVMLLIDFYATGAQLP